MAQGTQDALRQAEEILHQYLVRKDEHEKPMLTDHKKTIKTKEVKHGSRSSKV